MSDAAPLTVTAGMESAKASSALHRLAPLVLRYAFSALGPVSIAGAHFIAALVFLHEMQRADFGLFSFAFIVVPFCLSATGALFGAALVNSANQPEPMPQRELNAYMKANLVFAGFAALVIFGLMVEGTASIGMAAFIALYGAMMCIRWFARCYFYAIHRMPRSIVSDIIYSTALLGGLFAATLTHKLTPISGSAILAATAALAILGFGRTFLYAQARAIVAGRLRDFIPIWRDLARWSLLGVVATEMTANAHAYLVTFFAGPKAFALIAVGSLFMRPVTLILTALPDAERPAMARAIMNKKFEHAMRLVSHFRIAALATVATTAMIAAVVMIWFPQLILKRGYDEASVIAVISIWIAVMSVRALRTPESVLLQSAREFQPLATASMRSSVVSIVLTFLLLLAFGPVISLLGIFFGELVMTSRIFYLSRAWKARHG